MGTDRARSPLWLVVLALVCEAPMHPYRMQALIKERDKEKVANVSQRNSIYQAIRALKRAGLISVKETSRELRRPERTVYEPTQDGRRMLRMWLQTALATPAREFPDFPAALSLVTLLDPAEAADMLELRANKLASRLDELSVANADLARIFLIEAEYMASAARAELDWLRATITELRSGVLSWTPPEYMDVDQCLR